MLLKKSILLVILICFTLLGCNYQNPEKTEKNNSNIFFESFGDDKVTNSHYRIGAKSDTTLFNFNLRAVTTGYFDSIKYLTETIYILKHVSGDSLVIRTDDYPLISKNDFSKFYNDNKIKGSADTIVNFNFFDNFYIHPSGIIDFEKLDRYPFLFLDVNFNGYPALLERKTIGGSSFYKFQVYSITKDGFNKVDSEPYNMLKNRTNVWCFGGGTEIDYNNKAIIVHLLAPGSSSDFGTLINLTYKLNPQKELFDITQKESKYDLTN